MSLATLLLTGSEHGAAHAAHSSVDGALDDMFRAHPAPPQGKPITIPANLPVSSSIRAHKRKRKEEILEIQLEQRTAGSMGTSKASKRKKVALEERNEPSDEDDEDIEEDNAALEDAYLTQNAAPTTEDLLSEHEPSIEDDEDAEPPLHETRSSVPSKQRTKPLKKTKYVPQDETPPQRDARTIFVGNIPIDVAKSKSFQKQLKKHFTSRVSGAKIESVRFRSVAFASATAELPDEDGKPPPSPAVSTKRQRQKGRAATWREMVGETSDKEEEYVLPKKPSLLTPAERKRVAFIKGEFHKEVDTVNAYIVFAHTPQPDTATELSPIEAARLSVAQCDGSIFLDRTLRVDRVGQWRAGSGEENQHNEMGDPRATLFVGNLDFAAREEDLRVWFEGVVGQARGPRGIADADEEEDKWVQRVRIVRDRDTQLGKGFAYVRFADRECVDEVLALERESLKFTKRTLRVQRCKLVTSVGTSTTKPKPSTRPPAAPKPIRTKPAPVSVPAGDPSLGKRLAGLSKEDRKVAKAANVDRVQRRLAKKKARTGVERELQKRGSKVRDRERKRGSKLDMARPTHKGRIRSEKSAEKRNTKK